MIDDRRDIIGGLFGLHTPENSRGLPKQMSSATHDGPTFFCNARSAIHSILRATKPERVWLPSYLCPSMIKIPTAAATDCAYFPVNEQLNVSEWDWLTSVKRGDVVIVIDYFGFPVDSAFCDRVRGRGAFLVEDASQALLSDSVGNLTDYIVFSPRKFLGLPDGGVLWRRHSVPSVSEPHSAPDADWWISNFKGSLLRQRWDSGDHNIDRADWFHATRYAGRSVPCGPYSISTLTASLLLTNCVDWDAIRTRRRINYQTLLSYCSDSSLFPSLSADVVPVGFPINVREDERDEILKACYANFIYPPVHWRLEGHVPAEFQASHRLSRKAITLPCDQRYDVHDMRKMGEFVSELVK